MRVKADHIMKFEWVDDSKEIIPTIPNPVYIPRIGEVISFNLLNRDKSEFFDISAKVVSIKIMVYDTLVGEQAITISITKNLE